MDQITEKRIMTLHPKVRNEVTSLIKQCDDKLSGRAKVRIAQAFRTFEEQDGLYAQGRTKPGKIVTKAKSGSSWHNYGLAFDIVLIIDGKEASWDTNKDWDNDKKSDWLECAEIFQQAGWNWGKSFGDLPHFDKKFGMKIEDALAMYKAKKFIPNTQYIKI